MLFESLETRQVLSSFPAPIDNWQQAEFVDSEALVRFRADATQPQIQQLLSQLQAGIWTGWDELDMYHVRFPTARNRSETLAAIKTLHEQGIVEYAEPNFLYHPSVIPNDPLFGLQWGLENVGQQSPFPPFLGGVFDADIDATEAWDETTGNPNTIIAIIDTGVDYLHPDLAAHIWVNPGETPDGIDNDGNGFVDDVRGWDTFDNDNDPLDVGGHGTHVAGIAAAIGNNNTGVTGVSWNSQIMAIKAGNATSLSNAAIVGAQVYIHRMKVNFGFNIVVSNNSYGAIGPGAFSFAQFDAIRRATEAGILFVAAAGNQALNTDAPATPAYPAGYNLPGIISVAATDRTDTMSTFSNFGINSVDIGAPGEEIFSTAPTFLPPLAPQPPGTPVGYMWLDGTSMASPMVAGAVGVLRSLDPFMTNDEVKNLLMQTVDVVPSLAPRVKSGGRMNLAKALDQVTRNQISGKVWRDVDADGKLDANEIGLGGWVVYVDRNNNSVLDGAEPSTVTLADGTYNLRATLGAGTYKIREVVKPGFKQTFPNSSVGFAHTITLQSRSDSVSNLNFGNQPLPGSIDGIKYLDIDKPGNTLGVRDPDEPGLPGFVIYVDVNNDGLIGIGEPASITDSQGRFRINNVLPGTYTVREVQKAGYVQTEPAGGGGITGVVVIGNQITFGLVFGNRSAIDFGDAPDSYGTLKASNGPSHGLLPGFFLGDASDTANAHIDDEIDGLPSPDADGDDLDDTDDEDGVSFVTDVIPGQAATVRVDVSSGTFGSGFLQGWIDFNNDGDFLDAGEQIIKDRSLQTGTHLIGFLVPLDAAVADTFSRFRWSLQRGIGPIGPATAGEVEDHTTASRSVAPTANDDGPFTVARDSNFVDNEFDVMANDFPGVSGLPFEFLPGGVPPGTNAGGLLLIEDQGTADPTDDTIRYKPKPNYIGQDSFEYQIWDGVNVSNKGKVLINVVPTDPVAVDDTFDILKGSSNVALDVVANDIEGPAGALQIQTVSGTTAGGTVTIDAVNNRVLYTPLNANFTGADSFFYTVRDLSGKTSAAQVLVQVLDQLGEPADSHIVQIEFGLFDSNGNQLFNNAPVQLNETIELRAFTRDLRGSFPDPVIPGIPDASGVLSAYVDALYNSHLVHANPANNIFGIDITFGPLYPSARSATASTPGIVDEAGALISQQTEYFLGSGNNLLFAIKFTADAEGSLKFSPNPEEDSPTFTFETSVHSQTTGEPIVIPNEQIFFKSSPTIQIVGAGEAEATNPYNPLDVNQDTIVSPIDALLVISHLNRYGAGAFSPVLAASSGQGVPEYFLDVNVDGMVTAMDAKQVIDHLNLKAAAAGASSVQAEGEGEADGDTALLVASTASATSSSSSTPTSTPTTVDQTNYANSVDRVLTDGPLPTKSPLSVIQPIDEHDDAEESEEDGFFAELGSN